MKRDPKDLEYIDNASDWRVVGDSESKERYTSPFMLQDDD